MTTLFPEDENRTSSRKVC